MYNESLCCTYETQNPVYFNKNFLNKKNLSCTNFSDDTKKLKKNKIVQYQHKNRHTDQQNRECKNKPTYLQLVYNKGGRNIQWRKDTLFNKWFWENWTATCKTMRSEDSLTPY